MGDSSCMRRSAEVVINQNSSIVIVSATSGTTNQLIALGNCALRSDWSEVQFLIDQLIKKHQSIATDLKLSDEAMKGACELYEQMSSLSKGIFYLKDCSPKALDALMSIGERLSSILFTKAVQNELQKKGSSQNVQNLDARDFIITDESYGKAIPNIQLIFEKMKKLNLDNTIYVTQGFIGSSESGFTTTLGRGGSDYSAALIAEAVSAEILEIWTDVPGIATTDPRICKDARPIEEISIKEASELATFGAKILHPATLMPAMRKDIPVFVGSSFSPRDGGTWVKREVTQRPLVRALAVKNKQVLVTLTTPLMLNAHGFLYKIFKVFNDHKISVDSITTSEISVAVTLDDYVMEDKTLVKDLSEISEVSVEKDLTLVSLIGNGINHTPGLAKEIFNSIPDINVRMICLGASKHNFCLLVSSEKGNEVVKRLHQKFIT